MKTTNKQKQVRVNIDNETLEVLRSIDENLNDVQIIRGITAEILDNPNFADGFYWRWEQVKKNINEMKEITMMEPVDNIERENLVYFSVNDELYDLLQELKKVHNDSINNIVYDTIKNWLLVHQEDLHSPEVLQRLKSLSLI